MKKLFRKVALALSLVMTLASQTVQAADDLFGRLAMEGVDIVGNVSYMMVNYEQKEQGYYKFGYDNHFDVRLQNPLKSGLAYGGATYHDGKIYACEYDGNFRIDLQKPHWKIYDAKTFETLTDIEFGDNYSSTLFCITYDPTTDKIYGIKQMNAMEFCLVEVDPATGEQTQLGGVLDNRYRYKTLGCDKKGQLYIIYMESLNDDESTDVWYLDKVRKSDGKLVRVNTIDVTNLFDGDYYINDTRRQSLFCNFQTGKMYWIYPSSSGFLNVETTNIVELNTTTGVGTLKAYIPTPVLTTGAFFVEPNEKAPAIISDFSFVPENEGALTGKVKFTVPTEAYDGTALTGKQTVVVKEGDTELIRTELDPGAAYTSDDLTFTNAQHELSITVVNEAGEGPTVKRSFFAGFDVPRPCTNIKLTADGLWTTLTWDAPTKGENGAPVDASRLTYKVIRYPGEVTVADGIDECVFEEEHPAKMTRYVYRVIPSVGQADGKGAFSNNLIVGTPLDPPYGGQFNGPEDMLNYYTIIDANDDANHYGINDGTWGFKLPYAIYMYSPDNQADDWLIAPPINYKAGHTYQLTFKAHSASDEYPEAMEVTFGTDRTPNGQSKVLDVLNPIPTMSADGDDNEYSYEFTVPTDGVYYYGFHCISEAYHSVLYLSDIMLVEKAGADAVKTADVAGQAKVAYVTNLNGQHIQGLQHGVNIVKMTDGTTRKVVVK